MPAPSPLERLKRACDPCWAAGVVEPAAFVAKRNVVHCQTCHDEGLPASCQGVGGVGNDVFLCTIHAAEEAADKRTKNRQGAKA
jgi:hypothetical protein